ncbi:acyl-CoA thioesterase [Minwuia sp.]|uniref:acyl-CoA thioesterase n=1 Tax=Minwuia sp. TaxID=2493630 RepID=UPI003A926687
MTEPKPDLTTPSIFHHWSEDTIRFGDMDATGHVNNVAFARYVETGRVPFMRSGLLPAYDDRQRFVVGNLSIRFRAQAYYPGTVRIGTGVCALGRTSMTLGHGLFSGEDCIATAETVMVYIVGGRAQALTDDMRTALQPMLLAAP